MHDRRPVGVPHDHLERARAGARPQQASSTAREVVGDHGAAPGRPAGRQLSPGAGAQEDQQQHDQPDDADGGEALEHGAAGHVDQVDGLAR